MEKQIVRVLLRARDPDGGIPQHVAGRTIVRRILTCQKDTHGGCVDHPHEEEGSGRGSCGHFPSGLSTLSAAAGGVFGCCSLSRQPSIFPVQRFMQQHLEIGLVAKSSPAQRPRFRFGSTQPTLRARGFSLKSATADGRTTNLTGILQRRREAFGMTFQIHPLLACWSVEGCNRADRVAAM